MPTSAALLAALLWSGDALALDGNDRLVITLQGGLVVEGWFYRSDGEVVVVSGGNRFQSLPVDLIASVQTNGLSMPLEVFQAELRTAAHSLAPEVGVPHPATVTVAAAIWPGAGPALLGDWGDAAALTGLELAVIGAGALAARNDGGMGVFIPLAGLEVLMRVVTVDEVRREARRRRGGKPLRPPDIMPTTGQGGPTE
jgi:hypothetical protein